MKNSITKQSRGITLIALIITIVVLLILAVVAIGAAQESNIVGYAQNAATKYEQAQDNEIGLLSQYEQKIESILAKDRIYRLQGKNAYVKITKDNKVEFGSVDGNVEGPINFEYVAVTDNILSIVKKYGGTIPNNISDYSSRALKIKTGEDEYHYLLLSKDEKTLYYSGYALILDGASSSQPIISEWTTYGTESVYFLVGSNKAYLISDGVINDKINLDIENKTVEEYYAGTSWAHYTIADARLRNLYRILTFNTDEGERIFAVISDDRNNLYIFNHNSATGGTFEISLTYALNNNINYSSILDQIQ